MKFLKTAALAALCIVGFAAFASGGQKTSRLSARQGAWEAELVQESRSADAWSLHWGVFNPARPFRAVKELRLKHQGERIALPVSATSGLTNVNRIDLKPSKEGCLVKIDGSQTGEHYLCTIVIKGDQVVRREVQHGEMKGEAFERTVYGWVPDDGR